MASLPRVYIPTADGGGTDDTWWQGAPLAGSAAAPAVSKAQPRGVRNNNPLNIEAGNYTKAQEGFVGSDGRFAKFENMDQGFAAAENLLGTYHSKHGINTISGVINRWAPAGDGNPVSAYAGKVAQELGVDPNQPIDLANPVVRARVASSMAKFENGVDVPRSTDISAQSKPKADDGSWWQSAPLADAPKAVDQPKAPDVGRGTALLEGALAGVSGNFRDEILGASEASGLPNILGGFRAPIGAARLGIEAMRGERGEGTRLYEATVAKKRGEIKQAKEQYPGTFIAGEVGGAVALPVGRLMQGATLAGRMARGAGVGAGMGAVYGAGEGENAGERLSKATTGAALGAGVGAVAPPIVEGAIQAGRAAINPVVNAVRGAINPENEAARRVATAASRDMRNDPNAISRLTPGEFAADVQSGGPARLLDMGGETTRGLARSAANTSPEGRALLTQSINERFEGQGPRIINWLRQTFHYPNALAQQEALEQTARQVNRVNYARAYRDGARPLWDENLQQFTASPEFQAAIRDATRTGATDAAINGFRPPQNPFVFAADGTMTMRPGVDPTLQFWDQVKRNLDSQIGVAQRAGDAPLVRQLTQLRAGFVGHLDQLVPSYGAARGGAAHFFGAENALEAGENFVTSRLANDQARAALARMTPTERQLFQDGFVSRFIQQLSESGDRRNVLNQIAQSPAARERLHIAIGPQRAAELEASLRVEGIIDIARNAVSGNSTTARQLAELGFAGGAGSLGAYGTYNQNPGQMTAAAVAGALLAGRRGIDARVAQRVAEMLVSNDPQLMLRGVRLLARNTQMMNSIRGVDRRIAVIGGGQVPTGSTVQALGVGRAQEDQPDINRPSGQ